MDDVTTASHTQWQTFLKNCQDIVNNTDNTCVAGRITRVAGLVMEAVGLKLPVGSPCIIPLSDGQIIEAEVVGFQNDHLFLMPQSEVEGIVPGTVVYPMPSPSPLPSLTDEKIETQVYSGKTLPVGYSLLGRVVDSSGKPLDGKGAISGETLGPLNVRAINPLRRAPIKQTLDVGVRAINTLLTIGRGQRMGLFAGSGVGKSVLLGMMARYTQADVIVVGLIGERGREVKEFIEQILGEDGLARSAVVAAPADAPALMRLQGAAYATTIAEYFRDQGKNVLLLMDSLTRYAMAQREIALAIGEPPATKGYPPSVFAKLPGLVERTGNGEEGGGSITAFYTVLTEGDDQQDPIADAARAILDGHIVLNRSLAESGHYPAIDIEQSISRAMHMIISIDQQQQARRLKQLYSRYQQNKDLINVGAYIPGSDRLLDDAIKLMPKINGFLMQEMHEKATIQESFDRLNALFN